MEIRLANQTRIGADVQLWPMEWRALLTALPRGPDGQRIAAVIQAAPLEVTQPVRIAFDTRDLALIEVAAAQV
ncbi:MAG: hypothetical protein M3440_06660 [Chloroflexota bacterium]|nr:hypothetical protein [Chloroflexota bacterium]